MASLSSIAPCQHHTSLLAPFSNLPGRAVTVASSHANGSVSSCISSGGWRWPSSIPTVVRARAPPATMDNTNGIGIAEFYRGKNILVIGGTGFLAKGDKIGCFFPFVLLFFIPILILSHQFLWRRF
jgi:hypothetical protein